MKQNIAKEYKLLNNLNEAEDGSYVVTSKNQRTFNPINYNIWRHEVEISKLRNKDSIMILIADEEVTEEYKIVKEQAGYRYQEDKLRLSNYENLPFNVDIKESGIEMTKFQIEDNDFARKIFKNYNGKINSKCTFLANKYGNEVSIIKDIYGNTTGYFKFIQNKDKEKTINMLIVLPQCEKLNIILNNILTDFLPSFYPEMFADFVKDNWINDEEYMLPEIKRIQQEKKNIEEEYKVKLEEIERKIKQKQEENIFLFDIISSTGTGDKLVQAIIKCLKYLEYPKVEDWDKGKEYGELEEDLHIYKDEEYYFIGEVKGINGPPIKDDCNVIVKYKSRNCDKLGIPRIHGTVFFNYHKNVEPNKRDKLGFTKKEIKDAERGKYTLIGTYELFKAIRLCQENILKKEDVRKSIETPGLFTAIPTNFEQIGRIEDLLKKRK